MPLHTFAQLDVNTAYLLWEIQESKQELSKLVVLSAAEQQEYNTITHVRKSKEWLAARWALSKILIRLGDTPTPLYKNIYGKPMLTTHNAHISIAHCKGFALVALSKKRPIGVDLEQPHNKLYLIQDKFLNLEEIKNANNQLPKLCIYWCAKEAIYKTLGGNHISFRDDIYIYPFTNHTEGVIWGEGRKQLFKVHYTMLTTNATYFVTLSTKE